jgi:UPF0271 protein
VNAIDLNSDLGEGFGPFRVGADDDLFPLISSANVACGAHGGDPVTMERTIRMAREHGVAVGAHPGFPDRAGFGRRSMALSPAEIHAEVIFQVGALATFCRVAGVEMQHVKAHGALYNLAVREPDIARAIATAVRDVDPDLRFFALPGSTLERAGRKAGLQVAREAFADRAYLPDGSLAPRSLPGSLIHDPAVAAGRMVRLVTEGTIEAMDGSTLRLKADTICVHSDTDGAVAIATELVRQLGEAGVTIRNLSGNG